MRDEIATAERAAKSIQDKLDRLDEAFLFDRSIDIETYDRHAEKLREEPTLARIDRHSGQLEELDVEGILVFAERVLPRAADLWVQASLDQRQRFQHRSFRTELRSTEIALLEPGVTAPAFSYLRGIETEMKGVVNQTGNRTGPASDYPPQVTKVVPTAAVTFGSSGPVGVSVRVPLTVTKTPLTCCWSPLAGWCASRRHSSNTVRSRPLETKEKWPPARSDNARSDRESNRVSCELPLENECGHAHKTKRDVRRPQHFAIRVRFGDRVRPWAIGNGPTTRFLTPTPAMAPQSACHPRTQGTAPAEIRLVSPLRHRDPTSQQPALGDPQCRCARGSDAPCGRKSCPNTLSVSAPAGVAPPRSCSSRLPVSGAQRRRRVESGTRRGQRPVSAMSLPTHPTLSPAICSFANKTGPAPRSLWVGLRVDSRGGSDAPCGRKRRPKPGRRLSPAGTSLPPRSNSQLESRTCATASSRPEPEERQPMLRDCDCARSDPRWYGRARPRQGSARSARRGHARSRDLDAASARPRDGNCRSEPELTDVNTNRTRGRS